MFDLIKMAASNYVEIKIIQNGADILINRHTNINVFMLNGSLRKHANKLITEYFKDNLGGDLTENEAALLKLGIFFANAHHANDEHLKAVLLDGIKKIQNTSESKIRPRIVLEIISNTGY